MPRPGQQEHDAFVVDRVEGSMAVLVGEGDVQVEVPRKDLPAKCRTEGAMLQVPRKPDGTSDWKRSLRDSDAEKRRMADNYSRIERLKKRDPGGDVTI